MRVSCISGYRDGQADTLLLVKENLTAASMISPRISKLTPVLQLPGSIVRKLKQDNGPWKKKQARKFFGFVRSNSESLEI